jgi:hypothetical protein
MSRNRMIKPDFWEDEKTGRLDFPEMCLYIGLWNFADDAGRFRFNPHILRSQIFPYKDVTIKQMEKWMESISQFLVIYQVGETLYAEVKSWNRHQTINRPSASSLPSSEDGVILHGIFSEESVSTHAEIKLNEKKRNKDKAKFLDCVLLTSDEHSKLIEKYGETEATKKMQALNDYVMSKGKRYDSHYHTILMWDKKNEGTANAKQQEQPTAFMPPEII